MLCILSELSDDQLAAALAAGMIHPGATRKAIAAWRTRWSAAAAPDHHLTAIPAPTDDTTFP